MSTEKEAAATAPQNWPELSLCERRVLGVLIEKAKTTPDAYPMTMNALVTGCNQKSNRDPVMDLEDLDVEDALVKLQKKGLTTRITGSGRAEKWRHNAYDYLHLEKDEASVVAELLLRGPQTEGELRGRASRMGEIPDLEALRELLKGLAERKLAVYLTPEGRRGTVVTHGFHEPRELEGLRKRHAGSAGLDEPVRATPAAPRSSASDEKLATLEAALAETRGEIAQLKAQVGEAGELRAKVADLQSAVAALTQEFKTLKDALGG